jgi:hypothetical protein
MLNTGYMISNFSTMSGATIPIAHQFKNTNPWNPISWMPARFHHLLESWIGLSSRIWQTHAAKAPLEHRSLVLNPHGSLLVHQIPTCLNGSWLKRRLEAWSHMQAYCCCLPIFTSSVHNSTKGFYKEGTKCQIPILGCTRDWLIPSNPLYDRMKWCILGRPESTCRPSFRPTIPTHHQASIMDLNRFFEITVDKILQSKVSLFGRRNIGGT